MSKRIVLLVSSLAVIIGLMATSTSYAWFTTSSKKKQSITVLAVSSVHSARVSDLTAPYHTIIMPGDNLVNLDGKSAMLQIENQSTTDMQLRISVEYTSCRNGKAEQVIYSADPETDDIEVVFADRLWSKNIGTNGTCYFYYMGDKYESDELASLDNVPVIDPTTNTIYAVSKIAYKNDISDVYSGQPVNVKVIFESKQADNITWSAIDSYDISGVGK